MFAFLLVVICRYNWSSPLLSGIYNFTEKDTEEFLLEAAHPLNTTIEMCYLFQVRRNCSELFKVVATDAGKCSNAYSECVSMVRIHTASVFLWLEYLQRVCFHGSNGYSECVSMVQILTASVFAWLEYL